VSLTDAFSIQPTRRAPSSIGCDDGSVNGNPRLDEGTKSHLVPVSWSDPVGCDLMTIRRLGVKPVAPMK
jgi:hypothetical protein